MRKFISISIVTMMLCACINKGVNTAAIDNLSLDSVTIDTICPLTTEQNSPNCDIHLNIQYVKNGEHKDTINKNIINSGIFLPEFISHNKSYNIKIVVDSFVINYIKNYRNDFRYLFNQDKDNAETYKYTYIVNTSTHCYSDDVLTYTANVAYYAGGTHGIEQTFVRNFNITSGRLITLKDLLVPGYEIELKNIIINKLIKQFNVNDLAELKSMNIFYDGNIFIPENFILKNDEIIFIYHQEEIASHAVGKIRIIINKNEINNLLK